MNSSVDNTTIWSDRIRSKPNLNNDPRLAAAAAATVEKNAFFGENNGAIDSTTARLDANVVAGSTHLDDEVFYSSEEEAAINKLKEEGEKRKEAGEGRGEEGKEKVPSLVLKLPHNNDITVAEPMSESGEEENGSFRRHDENSLKEDVPIVIVNPKRKKADIKDYRKRVNKATATVNKAAATAAAAAAAVAKNSSETSRIQTSLNVFDGNGGDDGAYGSNNGGGGSGSGGGGGGSITGGEAPPPRCSGCVYYGKLINLLMKTLHSSVNFNF